MPFTKKYNRFPLILAVAALLALFVPAHPVIRSALTLVYALGTGALVGRLLFSRESAPWRMFWGALSLFAAFTVIGAVAYLAYRLDAVVTATILTLLPLILGNRVGSRESRVEKTVLENFSSTPDRDRGHAFRLFDSTFSIILAAAALFLATVGFGLLKDSATDLAIRTPWDAAPPQFFLILFLAILAVAALSFSHAPTAVWLIPAIIVTALASSVASIVYETGYGFDPFIHRAAERVILENGAITPKTPYYIGHYALVTIGARLTGVDVGAIDRWLVPLAFALLVPCAYWALRQYRGRGVEGSRGRGGEKTAATAVLLMPLAPFISTTPQGLADVFAIIAAFLALASTSLPITALFALAAAAVHPIAGVPALLLVVLLVLLRGPLLNRPRIFTIAVLCGAGAFAVPILFRVYAALSGTDVSIASAGEALALGLADSAPSGRRFSATLDFAYGWSEARPWLIALSAVAGIVLLRARAALALGLAAVVCAANAVILAAFVHLPFLIDYERGNYADRLFELALLLACPPAAYALLRLFVRLKDAGTPALRLTAVFLLALLATSSVYLAYPRRDAYAASRGWSTSSADIEAVRLIERDARGAEYVVLANQSVSAAAIGELGFKRYYRSSEDAEEIFFYPVPTGGKLYNRFLMMNAGRGGREVAEQSMMLAGVDTVYYVVNDYWWDARRIVLSARTEADGWWKIRDGQAFVFKYERRTRMEE